MINDALFVSDAVVSKTVKLGDGSEHVLHFKELPAIEFRRFYLAERSGDEDKQAEAMAKLIAASLCDADGKPAVTVKQALKLKSSAMNAISTAIMEINGFGVVEEKNP